jgi:hypothetical protein
MTALTAGYIYFLESDAGDNDDWITDHAGDPDLADISSHTDGTEICHLEIPQRFTKRMSTGIVTTPVGGGTSYSLRNEGRWYQVLARGIQTSRANAELVEKFFSIPRHTSGSSSTYVNYYLVIYFGTNDHVQFTDPSGNRKSYCPVDCAMVDVIWTDTENLICTVALQVNSVWTS